MSNVSHISTLYQVYTFLNIHSPLFEQSRGHVFEFDCNFRLLVVSAVSAIQTLLALPKAPVYPLLHSPHVFKTRAQSSRFKSSQLGADRHRSDLKRYRVARHICNLCNCIFEGRLLRCIKIFDSFVYDVVHFHNRDQR